MRLQTVLLSFALCAACPTMGRSAPTVEKLVRTAVALPSKPTGPIAADYRLSARPEVGVPLEIAVTARVELKVTGVGIEATATAPSAVLVATPVLERSEEGVYEWTITVVPLTADAGYLSIVISGSSEGTPQARAVTVSLRGKDESDAEAPVIAGRGERLIALPVQESP